MGYVTNYFLVYLNIIQAYGIIIEYTAILKGGFMKNPIITDLSGGGGGLIPL